LGIARATGSVAADAKGDKNDASGAGAAVRLQGVTNLGDGGGGGRPPRKASAAPVVTRKERGPTPPARNACPGCRRMSLPGIVRRRKRWLRHRSWR